MPTLRRFRARRPGEQDDTVVLRGSVGLVGPISWARRPVARSEPEPTVADPGIAALAAATTRALRATVEAHAAFLDAQDRATAPLARLIEALSAAAGAAPRVARSSDAD